MKNFLLTTSYIAVLALVVFLADRQESSHIFDWIRSIRGGDKVGHFFLMGGLSFVVNYSLKCRTLYFRAGTVLLGSLVTSVVVVGEEISQLYIPSRTFDPIDLLSDLLGIWLCGRVAVAVTKAQRVPVQNPR